ncbi:MAG: methylisocitrate lyase [Rhodanobacter sp.]
MSPPLSVCRVTPGASFREAVAREPPLQVVGVITAYTARMAQACGFQALYVSGGGVAANSLGMPDLGISTMEDVLIDVRRITDATTLPVLVDIDTGWGGAFNIARTIRSFIKAGAAAVHIEDQVSQKRCGHRPGKEVVDTAEMVDRIKAAVDARTDDSFVIMARTDAAATLGFQAVVDRTCAYAEAGADMIFPEAMTELAMYSEVKKAVNRPELANLTEFGATPIFSLEELRSVGVDMALYCCGAYRAMNAAALNFYRVLRRDGHQRAAIPTMQTRAELYEYLGYQAYEQKLDALFASKKIDESND